MPNASAQPTGSSTTPILVEDREKTAESIPPPPARREIVLALRAPSAAPVVQPKGRKRNFIKGDDGESSQQGWLNLAPGLRGKVCLSLWIFTLSSLDFVFFFKKNLVSFRIYNCSLVSQFVSLIDGMISECGSEASRLARDLSEMQMV